MQFKLLSLFASTSVVAVFCSVLFTAPLMMAMGFALFTLTLAPLCWLIGVAYSSGSLRAFYAGGFVASVIASPVAVCQVLMSTTDVILEIEQGRLACEALFQSRVLLALYWTYPILVSVSVGLIAMLLHHRSKRA